MQSKHLLYKSQYGFRKKHSTNQAIIELVSNFENNNTMIAVFLDLSKAFDTIDHNILLHKLEYYGVRGIALDWFISYLKDRKQYTEINGVTSKMKSINCGVPQGSVLEPLLFLIYINDMPISLKSALSITFADDSTVYYSNKKLSKLFETVNQDLGELSEWLMQIN